MQKDRYLTFVIVVAAIHLALFFGGFVFLGLDYSVLIAFLWAVIWVTYCGTRKKTDDDHYYDLISIPAMALIGGPFSWLLYPLCLSPKRQREATGEAHLWFVVQKVIIALKDAVMRIMDFIYSYCERDHPAKD